MNLSLRTLQARIPTLSDDPDGIVRRLEEREIRVARVVPLRELLEPIVVARVDEVSQHPNADRLKVCSVDDGSGQRLQVITGASNVRAGAWYPLVRSGTTLPNGTKIKKGKLRGEVSEGMLGSADELELGSDHDGLMTLSGELTPGMPLPAAIPVEGVVFVIEGDVTEDQVVEALAR